MEIDKNKMVSLISQLCEFHFFHNISCITWIISFGKNEDNIFALNNNLHGEIYANGGASNIEFVDAFELNKWQHVVFVSQSTNFYLYINGKLI